MIRRTKKIKIYPCDGEKKCKVSPFCFKNGGECCYTKTKKHWDKSKGGMEIGILNEK